MQNFAVREGSDERRALRRRRQPKRLRRLCREEVLLHRLQAAWRFWCRDGKKFRGQGRAAFVLLLGRSARSRGAGIQALRGQGVRVMR